MPRSRHARRSRGIRTATTRVPGYRARYHRRPRLGYSRLPSAAGDAARAGRGGARGNGDRSAKLAAAIDVSPPLILKVVQMGSGVGYAAGAAQVFDLGRRMTQAGGGDVRRVSFDAMRHQGDLRRVFLLENAFQLGHLLGQSHFELVQHALDEVEVAHASIAQRPDVRALRRWTRRTRSCLPHRRRDSY